MQAVGVCRSQLLVVKPKPTTSTQEPERAKETQIARKLIISVGSIARLSGLECRERENTSFRGGG
jgi:hypothetical protein